MKRKASISHGEAIVWRLRKDPDLRLSISKPLWKTRTNRAFYCLLCVTLPKRRE
jgi:hypothetical protein